MLLMAQTLEREIILLNSEVADLKKQLEHNLAALQNQHAKYIELCAAVMGGDGDTWKLDRIVMLATEQRELAEMFREAKK